MAAGDRKARCQPCCHTAWLFPQLRRSWVLPRAMGIAHKAGNKNCCNQQLMVHPKAPRKSLINPTLSGDHHQPHTLLQTLHSPECHSPCSWALDPAPMAAHTPNTQGEGRVNLHLVSWSHWDSEKRSQGESLSLAGHQLSLNLSLPPSFPCSLWLSHL